MPGLVHTDRNKQYIAALEHSNMCRDTCSLPWIQKRNFCIGIYSLNPLLQHSPRLDSKEKF